MTSPNYLIGQKFYRVYISPYHDRFHIDHEVITISSIDYVETWTNPAICHYRYEMSNGHSLIESGDTLVRSIETIGEKYFPTLDEAISYVNNTINNIMKTVSEARDKANVHLYALLLKENTIYEV